VRKELQETTLTAPLPQLVGQILERAFDCRATDIHFDSQETGLRVRSRIDGQLQGILFVETSMATAAAGEKVLLGLELDPDEHRDLHLHRGLGCPACFQTGYMGRTGIFEIMMVGEELRDLIFQQIPKDVLRRVAVDLGMRTLKQSAVDKILDGTTTVEEVYRVVSF